MLKYIKIIYNFTRNIPSGVFLAVYILTIPIFALIYTLFPYEFYHSTVQYEKDYYESWNLVQELANKEINDILFVNTCLPEILISCNVDKKGNYIIFDGVKFYKKNASYYVTNIEKDKISILADMNGFNNKKNSFYSISNKFTLQISDNFNNRYSVQLMPFDRNHKFINSGNKVLNSILSNRFGKLRWVLRDISKDFGDLIIGIGNAKRGFPSKIRGNFERMQYLSIVTITTIGYGDISPISSRTRWLVGIEALIGIFITGGFLNSLPNEFRKATGRQQ